VTDAPAPGLDEPAFIVKFADAELEDVLFSGYGAEEAARRYFDRKRAAWTVYLFKEIARG
jgi:hypothetical protein